jgi:hypothetical protein
VVFIVPRYGNWDLSGIVVTGDGSISYRTVGGDTGQQSGKFAATLDKLANYVGARCKHGGDIRRVVKNMATVGLVAPTDPAINASRGETKLWEIKGMTYRFDGEKYLPHAIADPTFRFS